MASNRTPASSQPSSALKGSSFTRDANTSAQLSPPAEQRSTLREAARRAAQHGAMDRRSPKRDDARLGNATAAGRSARRQADVAEHRQQQRGAAQMGPAHAEGNGKGADAR